MQPCAVYYYHDRSRKESILLKHVLKCSSKLQRIKKSYSALQSYKESKKVIPTIWDMTSQNQYNCTYTVYHALCESAALAATY